MTPDYSTGGTGKYVNSPRDDGLSRLLVGEQE
jgi:hypothetical protein